MGNISETLRLRRQGDTKGYRKDFKHAVGFPQTSSFRRKSFSLRLISSGGKMDRMPMPCAMGLALECFHKIIPSKGMIFWKIFPTSRHSIHVRMIVRKATLNGPKRFGYFWAPKVTEEMDDKYFAHAVRYPLTVDRFSFFKKMLPMRFWVVDLYRRDFENRGISLIKIDINLGLYRAGVCDTPLQYWGLSSE